MTDKIKLDIGSGVAKKAGYITIDSDKSVGADILADILQEANSTIRRKVRELTNNGDGFGWNNLEIDEIRCHHLLEHLPPANKVKIMRIMFDLLKPGGILDIEVPLFPHPASVQDPTHLTFWNKESFWYFTKGNKFGEAFAKRYSQEAVPLFEFVEETWRAIGIKGYCSKGAIEDTGKEGLWAYRIILRKPKA